MDFTELNTIDDQFSLYASDPRAMKKTSFTEIDSQGEGDRFKKSDISYTGG